MDRYKVWILGAAAVVALVLGGSAIAAATGEDDSVGNSGTTPATESADHEGAEAGEPEDGGSEDEGAKDDDSSDTAIAGDPLQQASDAALKHTGAGRVTATEVNDEESYYEVEVTLPDGGQVDVQLDRAFNVVGTDG
jgi:uncharacterized membrane protein YkoI